MPIFKVLLCLLVGYLPLICIFRSANKLYNFDFLHCYKTDVLISFIFHHNGLFGCLLVAH